WGKIGEYLSSKLKVKHLKLIPLAVIIILYFSGYKIVKSAQHYYSPNTDFYGDVQIADYKSIFTYIQKKFPNLKDIALFNDSIDAQRWYLEKIPEAYFVKKSANFYINTSNNVSFYSSLDYFLKEKSKYPKGLLIVEDWDSFLPEDIKLYAKKNMKLEFRIENLPQAHNDPWPLEVYSWGIEYNKK
ncbi:hypothetical protein HY041_00980, partial [Candidatus Roizmanbacteria bacterium]|nr:hypothetical protein [Candidatus Roizmanbacteria bacterium]